MKRDSDLDLTKNDRFISHSPIDGSIIGEFSYHSVREVHDFINSGVEQQKTWQNISSMEKMRSFKALKVSLLSNRFFLAELMTEEMGKPIKQSFQEIDKSIGLIDTLIGQFKAWFGDTLVSLGGNSEQAIIRKSPLGQIIGVMPWNFPLWQVMRFALPALALGNRVLLKHSDEVASFAQYIAEIMNATFPEGLYQNVLLKPQEFHQIFENDHIRGLAFTGSTRVGHILNEQASRKMIKTVFELGGADPFVVLEGANLVEAVELAVIARTQNTGQSCIAAKRFIIHHTLFDEFQKLLILKLKQLKIGDPRLEETDLGPLVSIEAKKRAEDIVKMAQERGDKVLFEREIDFKDMCHDLQKEQFFAPVVIKTDFSDSLFNTEETFAPVFPLGSFVNIEDAKQMALKTPYALGASVHGEKDKAFEFARFFDAGNVAINSLVKSHPLLPFGGNKNSGKGRELGEWGACEFANIQSIIFRP